MLAFSFLRHKKDDYFDKLFTHLYREENIYAIHVDRHAAELYRHTKHLEQVYPNVIVISVFRCGWGGWSLVKAELALLQQLLNVEGWEFCVNLSGNCFPIKPYSHIERTVTTLKKNLIESYPVPVECLYAKRFRSWFFELALPYKNRILRVPWLARTYRRPVYKGSQWKIMKRDFCEFALHSEESQAFQKYFCSTHIPDEHFFPTLIRKSKFHQDHINNNAHFIQWYDWKPVVLTPEHLDDLASSPKLFARKVDPQVSDGLVQALEGELLVDS
jgi:hypothetical protein